MATVQWRDQCRSRSASRRFLRLPWLPTLGFVQANALKSLINPNFLGGKQSFIGRTQSFEYRCWRGLRAVRLGCSRSAVCHNRIWNKFERHKDQTRHDNRIIQMSKHRDEIGNDVKRRRKIRDSDAKHPFRRPGRPFILEQEAANSQFGSCPENLRI